MFELLFCPQHGLFRAENLQIMLGYSAAVSVEIQMLYIRLRLLAVKFL